MRCLEKDPVDRPSNAEAILETLDAIPAQSSARAVADRVRSVAVLPLANVSGDVENEHFSDGLTDELIGALSQVRQLSVCGRTSAFALKGQGLSVEEIAKRLGVRNIVEGSVRRSGERIKVRVQLVDSEGNVIWSDAYDRKLTDVFAVQEEIAQAVARALQIHLTGPLVRPATKDLVAYDLFLKGRAIRRRFTPHDLELAIVYFEQAIARDPEYAAAYAWLSDAHTLQLVMGSKATTEGAERARGYARQAVELDPKLADAHWALGQVLMCFDRDLRGADREYESALAIDPGHVDARHLHGVSLLAQQRYEAALGELSQAIAVDPLLAEAHLTAGRTYIGMRQPETAIAFLRNVVDLAPDFAFARSYLARALLQLGRNDEALTQLERAVTTGGPRAAALLAYGYAVTGRPDQAREVLRSLTEEGGAGVAAPFHVAVAYAGLESADLAFEWLNRAERRPDPWVTMVNSDPAFDGIRDDARYGSFVQRLGIGAVIRSASPPRAS
jgi:TolB-like protein/Tfp pilus assembly protein PilF